MWQRLTSRRTNTKVSAILSSNCLSPTLLFRWLVSTDFNQNPRDHEWEKVHVDAAGCDL